MSVSIWPASTFDVPQEGVKGGEIPNSVSLENPTSKTEVFRTNVRRLLEEQWLWHDTLGRGAYEVIGIEKERGYFKDTEIAGDILSI